ncbi:seminal metalloprotease 1 isoform X2 [Helicoverpa armigera]|uniref:seminal metalloprotease 1 isoform X2 n=1 Tax=Helicoverpa armigera TaxID=29058 RepID=UPI0030828D8E
MIRVLFSVHSICLIIFFIKNVALEETYNEEVEDITNEYDDEIQIVPPIGAQSEELPDTPITVQWKQGKVPYYINKDHYGQTIRNRIRLVMNMLERISCVVFEDIELKPPRTKKARGDLWINIENPRKTRECSHTLMKGYGDSAVLVLGYDCMSTTEITHALMHALGFPDEVTLPSRDNFVRIMWNNIQPKYRPLFWAQNTKGNQRNALKDYDPMSIMHFHDRAYTINGGPTIVPLNPSIVLKPPSGLSELDRSNIYKAFRHECNKRKVNNLIEHCRVDYVDEYDDYDHEDHDVTPL